MTEPTSPAASRPAVLRAEADYRARTPRSAALAAEAARRIPGGGLSRQTLAFEPYPFHAASAAGQWITDVDGNRYRDLSNNYTSLIHGHAHPGIARAVGAVLAGEGAAVGAPSPLEARLAEALAARMPILERVRFTTSGSEALGFAVRVARVATGRTRVLKLEGGFHGAFGELQQDIGNPPLPPGTAAPARPSTGGLEPTTTITMIANDLASADAAFATWGPEIAVVVMEPFLGNGALLDVEPAFAQRVEALARAHGALVLADEVQGVRVDPAGAHRALGLTPDLVALGKVVGGGQPLAAYGGRADLMAVLDRGAVTQTGTFTASPVALAAGLAALADWGPDEQARLDALGERMRAAVREVLAAAGVPAVITGRGSMLHVSLADRPIRAYRDVMAADLESWLRLRLALLVRGVLLMRRGTGCLSTPMDERDVDAVAAALEDALRPA